MLKVGLSMGVTSISEAYFQNCRKTGISKIEVSVGNVKNEPDVNYKAVQEYAKNYEVNLWSYHLPFVPFEMVDISALDKQLQNRSVDYLGEIIRKAADIGIDKYVIHPSGEPIAQEERYEKMQRAKESLVKLARVAAECGGVIAVEDLPRTCLGRDSDEILELLSADERLRVCFDTNHLLKENLVDFVHKVGHKIITTHISDYDFINERHWLPGEGKIDWPSLIGALKEVGYHGVWLYEIGFKCPNSIIRDRDMTHEDFVRNAAELFAGKAPTIFATHLPELGMWPTK